jgi:hypothetical protein
VIDRGVERWGTSCGFGVGMVDVDVEVEVDVTAFLFLLDSETTITERYKRTENQKRRGCATI